MDRPITRRRFVGLGLAGTATMLAGGGLPAPAAASEEGRLTARPGRLTGSAVPGIRDLGLARGRDGVLYVPEGYRAERPWPLLVLLHGALGRTATFTALCRLAGETGIVVVEPDARGQTWDFDLTGAGRDLAFLDRALARVFARVAVDPRRLGLGGFSDGASYALSAGLANGDLFTHLIAFSPGFINPPGRRGKPRAWVSHGVEDGILPVESSRRRIVPQLNDWGYEVRYREFEGGHEVKPELARDAFRWFLSS
jgi:phospholipase/carboxylesterase